jgi:hypothetical protein
MMDRPFFHEAIDEWSRRISLLLFCSEQIALPPLLSFKLGVTKNTLITTPHFYFIKKKTVPPLTERGDTTLSKVLNASWSKKNFCVKKELACSCIDGFVDKIKRLALSPATC